MKQINILKKMLCMAIFIIMMLICHISLALTQGTIAVETANLRETASSSAKILELASKGEQVEILSEEGDWYKVKYKNITGYLRSDLVKVKEETVETASKVESSSNVENSSNTESSSNTENSSNTESSNDAENSSNTENQNNVEDSSNINNSTNSSDENTNNVEENVSEQQTVSNQDESSQIGKYKTTSDIKLKITPLIMSIEIADIPNAQDVDVTQLVNGWAYTNYQGKQGWVRVEKLQKQENDAVSGEQSQEQTQGQADGQQNDAQSQQNAEQSEAQQETQQSQQTSQESSTNTQQPTSKTMYVNSQTINLRKQANKTSEVVSQLSLNTEVEVVSEENGWSKVNVNGKTGYILSTLLSEKKQVTTRASDEPRAMATDVSSSSVSSAQDTTSSASSSATSSETSSVTSSGTSSGASTTATSGNGASVVSYANQFLGCKYVYGGTSPNGFDCSGFTYYVYKHFGVTLNRTAAGQYSNGRKVSKSELQPGDLVMFGSPIWHVGIYIGNGKIIHAANPSRGVTTDTINSGYYANNYTGARRIF